MAQAKASAKFSDESGIVSRPSIRHESPPEDRLDPAEVRDERDVSPRAPSPEAKGRRVRAIPAKGGTTILIRHADFARSGIENPDVEWDFRRDNFTVPVGPILSEKAADWLCQSFPESFEYIGK